MPKQLLLKALPILNIREDNCLGGPGGGTGNTNSTELDMSDDGFTKR